LSQDLALKLILSGFDSFCGKLCSFPFKQVAFQALGNFAGFVRNEFANLG